MGGLGLEPRTNALKGRYYISVCISLSINYEYHFFGCSLCCSIDSSFFRLSHPFREKRLLPFEPKQTLSRTAQAGFEARLTRTLAQTPLKRWLSLLPVSLDGQRAYACDHNVSQVCTKFRPETGNQVRTPDLLITNSLLQALQCS
jgi:hypothetical protein